MIVVRPISRRDTEDFIKFSFTAGIGMTSMPKHEEMLAKKVIDSEIAFSKDAKQPGKENYLFVLEDLSSKSVGGTSGINAKTGVDQPKYYFTIDRDNKNIPLMRPISYRNAPSEICSLYLLPEFRKEGLGKLLSLSRFLFIAAHIKRFDSVIYAEMRGFVDKNQNCPFWEGIGRHFLDIDYTALMHLRDRGDFDITQVIPKYPIYIFLLPKEVQEVIGKIHSSTWPAYHMLMEEGFYATNDVDVYDAGPKIQAQTTEIRTIKNSCSEAVAEIVRTPIESTRYIISNQRLEFRACYSTLQKGSKGICIPVECAEALKVKPGDIVRYAVVPSPEISTHSGHQASPKGYGL